jgi:hypothetical protein
MGHVTHVGEMRSAYSILAGKPETTQKTDIDGKIILKWNFGK